MDEGRVAIVTGGGQGIGRAIVKKLLEEGLKVVIVEMDEKAGREALEEYHSLGECVFIHVDVSDEREVKAVVRETVASFRRLDSLISNAGIFINRPLGKVSLAEWNRVLGVNLTGTFLCAKYSAPHLAKNKGSIVNIASTRAIMSEPDTEDYQPHRAAQWHSPIPWRSVSGLMSALTASAPGWIDVSGWKKQRAGCATKLSEMDHKQHPAGRVGRPEDIASLAAYLISAESGFITGANFISDGGMTRKMIYV